MRKTKTPKYIISIQREMIKRGLGLKKDMIEIEEIKIKEKKRINLIVLKKSSAEITNLLTKVLKINTKDFQERKSLEINLHPLFDDFVHHDNQL